MSTLTQTRPQELSTEKAHTNPPAVVFEHQQFATMNLHQEDTPPMVIPSSTDSTASTAALSLSGDIVQSAIDSNEGDPNAPERAPPQRKDSNLSMGDLYAGKEDADRFFNGSELGAAQTGDDDSHRSWNALDTPPESLTPLLTPSIPETDTLDLISLPQNAPFLASPQSSQINYCATATEISPLVASAASSASGSTPQPRHPVLYSAIGSLEDPNSSSYSKAWIKKQQRAQFDFPSCAMFIPPVAMQQKVYQQRHGKERQQPQLLVSSTTRKQPKEMRSSLSARLTAFDKEEKDRKLSPSGDSSVDQDQSKQKTDKSQQKPSDDDKGNPPSILRSNVKPEKEKTKAKGSSSKKKVSISERNASSSGGRRRRTNKGPIEMFRPSSDAYTPRMGKKDLKYKPAEMRTPVQKMASPMGTLSRPNFRDALRRVAMILHQHIVKIESRFDRSDLRKDDGLFLDSMRDAFSEENYATPKYRCTMVRVPMARPGMVFGLKQIRQHYEIPSESEIYEFAHQLFDKVQLSSECSIVCLIYVERLMEQAKVPLMACTWRPIFMCGLLLASKVWQDLSSWNIEFASVYPQYSLDSINRLELQFLRMVKWDLYISSSLYAKYYFALRSVVEKPDFRNRYNRMVGGVDSVRDSEARKIEERSTQVKEEALLQLSRSM